MGAFGKTSALLLCGTATALLMAVSGASAQSGQDVELQPVIVEGQQTDAAKAEPQQDKTTTKVNKAVLDQRLIDSFEDVGRRVDAGVNFNANNRSVNLRGLQDSRVLTTIDGIRIPWLVDPRDSARGGLNAIDFDTLSSLDIQRGADSSRYGSGALGGVVQLRTLNPEDLIDEGKNFGGIVKGSYVSADESWRTNAAVAGRFNDTWVMVQGGYRRGHETDNMGNIDAYGATRTEPNPVDYDQKNFLGKIHQYVEGGHRFGLTGEIFNREDDIHNMSGTTGSYVRGTFYSGEVVKRNRISADYQFESPDKSDWVDRANLTAFWQDQQLNAITDAIRQGALPNGVYKRNNELNQATYGLFGDGEKEVQIGSLSHTFRFGGEALVGALDQYSAGVDNCPVPLPNPAPGTCAFLGSNHSDMPDVDSKSFGFFVEDDIKFDRLTLTPGARVDWYDYDPSSTPEFAKSPTFAQSNLIGNSDARISPKLRAAFQATERLEVFGQWAQGFRAPTALDLYGNYGNIGQYVRIGQPLLKPETSNGFEAGFKVTGDNYNFSFNAFNNYYRNFIEGYTLVPPPAGYLTGFSVANVAKAHIYGAEIRGDVDINDQWRAWASAAVSKGTATDDRLGEYTLSSVAPFKAILGLAYTNETWGADVSATFAAPRQSNTGRPTVAGGQGGGFKAPGYGLVDASVWWSPSQVKGLKLQAAVLNVFDQKYWNVTDIPDSSTAPRDRLTEPGRTFRLSVTHKF